MVTYVIRERVTSKVKVKSKINIDGKIGILKKERKYMKKDT